MASAPLTLAITDSNDPPKVAFANPVASLSEDTDTSVAVKVADIVVTDDALGTNNLSLAGADAASFEIAGSQLRLKAGTVLDFEVKSSFSVTVQVDDPAVGATPDDSAALTLTLNNANELPQVSLANVVASLPEGSNTSSSVPIADIVITDDGLGTNDLSLAGLDAASFEIAGSQLRLKAGTMLDFETKNSYEVTVRVDDASLGTFPDDTASTVLTITDVNEPPTVSLSNPVASLAESTDTSIAVRVADITVNDDALGTNSLSLSGPDAANFEIAGSELRLRAGTSLDFETKPTLNVTVQVDDTSVGSTPDHTAALAIAITNANEAPTATNLNQSKEYLEGSASVALDDIVVSDVDSGDTITARLTVTNPAAGFADHGHLRFYNQHVRWRDRRVAGHGLGGRRECRFGGRGFRSQRQHQCHGADACAGCRG